MQQQSTNNQSTNYDYRKLKAILSQFIDNSRLISDPDRCYSLATDASFYRLVPKVIVKLKSEDELRQTLIACKELAIPYTFRAAGTSLSGQAISDSVLIQLTSDWNHHKIIDDGLKIQLQPGVIGANANRWLAPYGRKIGPDPASINHCKIGGIAANNSSGMCCGTVDNSYNTLSSMVIVFADGTRLDTQDEFSIAEFKQSHPVILDSLKSLSKDVRSDPELSELIKRKYRIKNTTGYGLNSLLDFDDPIEILQHLMIGSEGTLGFISSITYHTVCDHQFKACGLFFLADIKSACELVTQLKSQPVSAVEIMDNRSLNCLSDEASLSDLLDSVQPGTTALLVECQADSKEQLKIKVQQTMVAIKSFTLSKPTDFSFEKTVCENLWKVRKGLFPAVGSVRKVGTSVIIEDIAFPIEYLSEGTLALQQLFVKHDYQEAIIFGHALEGNLHFVFTQDFSKQEEVNRYKNFMLDVTNLVAKRFSGSLKAEHGTGRNMAPFVELEWGKRGYAIMQQIKSLFDPDSLVNPGVIINQDSDIHTKDLKVIPNVNPIIDRCIECGFCESVCPSRELSLTPRQRIVMYRQLQSMKLENVQSENKLNHLQKIFNYSAVDTCAATGLCEIQCPVSINTGELVLEIRQKKNRKYHKFAKFIANHFATMTVLTRGLFRLNSLLQLLLPNRWINRIGKKTNQLSHGKIPIWFSEYPVAVSPIKLTDPAANSKRDEQKKVVYLPSCASRTLAGQKSRTGHKTRSLTQLTVDLLGKAGYRIIIPEDIAQLCCGMPFQSKGLGDIASEKQDELIQSLVNASENGKHPIVFDTSPCALRTKQNIPTKLKVYEALDFAYQYLLPRFQISQTKETIALHVTCSSRKMNASDTIVKLAKLCATDVFIPDDIQCCGWSGDKGFTLPELNRSALSSLKNQLPKDCKRGFSNSMTCEIGLSHHSGITYQSLLYLFDEVSMPLYP